MNNRITRIAKETTYVESEPRPGSAEQDLSVLPLTEVVAEISPRGLGNIDLLGNDAVIGTGLDTLVGTFDVLNSPLHVPFDIESETRGLGDGKTEVESDNTGHASKTDEETPAVVDGFGRRGRLAEDLALVGVDDDERDEGGG